MNQRKLAGILEEILDQVTPIVGKGHVADYIPLLAQVPREQFGMAVTLPDGTTSSVGRAQTKFSLQSVAKVFALTLAMKAAPELLWERVGREPSGNPFNSLVQLEYEHGIPRNPFINAGSLVVTDVLISQTSDAKQGMLDFVRKLTRDSSIEYDYAVAQSEKEHGFRNAALANFIKSFGLIDSDVEQLLDVYFHHCSLALTCEEVARAALYLAQDGVLPNTGEEILTPHEVRGVNSLMLTCGTYDAVGKFSYRVGLPAKSGIGGGIVAVMPRTLSICVWSPGLDNSGNSLAGTLALELFSQKTGLCVF